MDVSIIIVNYNTLQLTQNCIESIVEKTTEIEYEIIVVDNASTDGSREMLSQDSRIKYIYSDSNGGFGYGNNRGMELAQGKYFLLLNSDTLLINNAVKEFYDYAESHHPKTVYGCYLEGEDGSYRGSFHFFPAFTIRQFFHRMIRRQNYTPDYINKEVECICGADMFFPRTGYETVGGFNERIFLYGEEGELQYRLKKAGYSCFIINTPRIQHLEGKSSTPSIWKDCIKLKSHFVILKTHMCYFTYILARLYYAIRLGIMNFKYIKDKEGRRFLLLLVSKV